MTDAHIRILRQLAHQSQRKLADHLAAHAIGDVASKGRRDHLERAATRSRSQVAGARARRELRRSARLSRGPAAVPNHDLDV